MKVDKKVWGKVYKEKGRYFDKPHRDLPKIAKILKRAKAKRVLDLGCGTGRHLVFLAKQGLDVYGTDVSGIAIKMSKEWLNNEKLSASLKIHDMTKKLPFKDNFFDCVISIQVIHHAEIKSIRNTISEIYRILKKDGLVFVTVPIYSGPITGVKKGSWTMKEIATRTYIPQDGIEKGLPHYFFKKEELVKEFKEFKVDKTYFDDTNHYCLLGFKK